MTDQRLLDFIKNEREKGTEKSVIRNRLLESGWSSQEIEGAFRELENQGKSQNKNNILYLSLALVSLVAVSGFFLLDPANIFSGNQDYSKNKSSTGNLEGDNKTSSLVDIIKAGEFECHGKFKGNYKGQERNMDIDIWVKENNSKVLLTKEDSRMGYMVKGTNLYTYIVNWTGPYDRNLKQKNRLSSRQRISEMSEYNKEGFCFKSDISADQFKLETPSKVSSDKDEEQKKSEESGDIDTWKEYGETLCSNDKYSTELVYTDMTSSEQQDEVYCDLINDKILVNLDETSKRSLSEEGVNMQKVSELSCLESLKIPSGSQVSSFSHLTNLRNLKSLVLRSNEVKDFSFLEELDNLQCLSLKIANISKFPISPNLKLRKLDITNTRVKEVKRLKDQKKLVYLEIDGRNIEDFSFLSELSSLEHLAIRGKASVKANDFSGLSPKIDDLRIEKSSFSDIDVLKDMEKLKYLDLSTTMVSDISVLADLDNLTSINLRLTEVTDISPLKEISGLKKVNLAYNDVSDFSPLMNLKEPAEWIEINLIGTGISDDQCDKLQDKYGFDNVLC